MPFTKKYYYKIIHIIYRKWLHTILTTIFIPPYYINHITMLKMETEVLTKIDPKDNLVLKIKIGMHKLSESSRKNLSNMDHHMGIVFHIKIYENIFDVLDFHG
jgi:hypothetical protein